MITLDFEPFVDDAMWTRLKLLVKLKKLLQALEWPQAPRFFLRAILNSTLLNLVFNLNHNLVFNSKKNLSDFWKWCASFQKKRSWKFTSVCFLAKVWSTQLYSNKAGKVQTMMRNNSNFLIVWIRVVVGIWNQQWMLQQKVTKGIQIVAINAIAKKYHSHSLCAHVIFARLNQLTVIIAAKFARFCIHLRFVPMAL